MTSPNNIVQAKRVKLWLGPTDATVPTGLEAPTGDRNIEDERRGVLGPDRPADGLLFVLNGYVTAKDRFQLEFDVSLVDGAAGR